MNLFGVDSDSLLGFVVRFLFGAVVGALIGYAVGYVWAPNSHWLIGITAALALIFGLLAAWLGDDFWKTVTDCLALWTWRF